MPLYLNRRPAKCFWIILTFKRFTSTLKFNIDLFDQILILAISHDIAKFELLDEARAVVEDEHQCSLLHLMPMLNIRFLCPLSINIRTNWYHYVCLRELIAKLVLPINYPASGHWHPGHVQACLSLTIYVARYATCTEYMPMHIWNT